MTDLNRASAARLGEIIHNLWRSLALHSHDRYEPKICFKPCNRHTR